MNTEKSNKVAMMQPTFLPWQGYFELINNADTFIFLDDFQYSVGSFHNRNRLFISYNQADYVTVPVNKKISFKKALNLVPTPVDVYWKKQICKTITYNYQKAPFFHDIWDTMYPALARQYSQLAELNISLIKTICSILKIQKNFVLSSTLTKSGQRSQEVYSILKSTNASSYLCANGAFEYMLEDKIFPNEIPVLFQNYQPKPYNQINSKKFIPYLSILDALFNIGPEETLKLVEHGTEKWLSWDERHTQFMEQNNE